MQLRGAKPGALHDLDDALGHLVAEHAHGHDLRWQAAHDVVDETWRDLARRRSEDEADGISAHGDGEQRILLARRAKHLHEHGTNSSRTAAPGSTLVTSDSPTRTAS